MSLSSAFSSIFGSGGAAATPAPAPAATTTVAAPAVPVVTTPAPPETPLDPFTKIWEAVPTPKTPDSTRPGQIFAGADPAKMLEAARGVDFSRAVDPSVLTRIAAGGEDGAKAVLELANNIGQQAYAQGAFAGTQMIERGLERYDTGATSRLPSAIRKHHVSESVLESNPGLQHPAVAPIVGLLEAQFAAKYPQATAKEIRDYTLNYLNGASKIISGGTAEGRQVAAANASKDDDWTDFFNAAAR